MGLPVLEIQDAIVSELQKSGLFVKVNQHEPKAAPRAIRTTDLHAAVWVNSIAPAASGLASTSVRVVYTIRLYQAFLSEPQDLIDPNLIHAVDALLEQYSADFDFGGLCRNIDLLGNGGTPLSAIAGYLEQDNKVYRVMDITLPVVLNDVWGQA